MPHKLLVAAVAALTGLAPACADGDDDSKAKDEPPAVNVRVGGRDPEDKTIAVMAFLPARVPVAVGDVVQWTFDGPVVHTVTFLPAGQPPPEPGAVDDYFASSTPKGGFDGSQLANSGRRPSDTLPEPYRLEFPKGGEYAYLCVIHPRMTGAVIVGDDGGVLSARDVEATGEQELANALREARASKQNMLRTASAPPSPTPDGGRAFTVEMGTSTTQADVLAFAPSSLTVSVGDRVTFVNNSLSEHTASFGGELVPRDRNSPRAREPAPGPSPQPLVAGLFLGTGALPPHPFGAGPNLDPSARSYSFVAATAGTYTFVCVFHQGAGMTGSITVQ